MARITEHDVVTFLQEKVSNLEVELARAKTALESFTGISGPGSKQLKFKTLKGSAGSQWSKSNGTLKDPSAMSVKTLISPPEFKKNLKLHEKVAYALAHTGPASKEDVIKILSDLDPEADVQKLERDLAVKLSTLLKKGLVNARKEGRRYKYSL